MASYIFLYAASASLLPKLDQIRSKIFEAKLTPTGSLLGFGMTGYNLIEMNQMMGVSDDTKKDVMEWKEILSNLPSLIETHEFSKEGFLSISKFVYGFRNCNNKKDWKSLVGYMSKFTDYYSQTKKPAEESSSGVNLDELDTKTSLHSSLRLALSSLKAPDVKPLDDFPLQLLPCLAYCALYPQGSTFVRETLIYQWMVEGFLLGDRLEDDESLSEQVKRGNFYFNKLLEKGVFVEPIFASGDRSSSDAYKRIHSCKIHPDIHSAVCRMASNEVFIIPDTKHRSAAAAVTTRYVAFHKEDAGIQYEFPLQPKTFMCFIPEINKVNLQSLVSKFEELHALNFAGTQFEELPNEFTAFTKLRRLAVSRNTLLKRLDCSHFEKLKTLAVDECDKLEKVDTANKVEILQLSRCQELKSFTVAPYKLKILRIFECPRLESFPQKIGYHLKELVCHNCDSLDFDLEKNLGSTDYAEVVSLPKLIELKLGMFKSNSLLIANCSNLKSMDDYLHKSIYTLHKLCIYDCPNLEISPKVLSLMSGLMSLDLRNCPTIMTTTFSNNAMEDLVPWIWNKDRKFIIDGQRHPTQEVGSLEEIDDAALGPLVPSLCAQKSSYVPSSPDSCATQVFALISEIKSCPKWRLEQLKLYCSHLFRKDLDFEFEKDALVQLWTASEMYLLPLEHFGYMSFDPLLEEDFIIESRTDILTGIIKYKINVEKATTPLNQVVGKDQYALLDDDNGFIGVDKSKCRHLLIVSKSISPSTVVKLEGICELRTVKLIGDCGDSLTQVPSSFFEALTCLRALDLSGSHISELPSSIGNMTQLHYLDLSFTLLERIPESLTTHLKELQTLRLKGCKHLHTLPKGMKQLHSLRHLDFDILGQLTSMPKGMGQLTKLQTLSAFIVSEEDGCSITELENLNWLRGSFCISGLEYASGDDAEVAAIVKKVYLTKLHLKWKESKAYDNSARSKASSTLRSLEPNAYASLQHLQISYYPGSDLPKWFKNLKYLVSVTLHRCENEEIKGLELLKNLKHLTLIDINKVTTMDIKIDSLETLTIDGMKKLQNLFTHDFTLRLSLQEMHVKHCPKLQSHRLKFDKLKYLEISHCKSWTNMLYELPESLDTLVIINCPLLKKAFSDEKGRNWNTRKDVPNIWIDKKGFGKENKHTDDSDDSDEEIDLSDDSSDSDNDIMT